MSLLNYKDFVNGRRAKTIAAINNNLDDVFAEANKEHLETPQAVSCEVFVSSPGDAPPEDVSDNLSVEWPSIPSPESVEVTVNIPARIEIVPEQMTESREARWVRESITIPSASSPFDPTQAEPLRELNVERIVEAEEQTDRLNKATVKELRSIKGIGPKIAEKIVNARPFLSVANVRQCVSDAVFERIQEWLASS